MGVTFSTVWQNILLALVVSALASIYPALKAVKLNIAGLRGVKISGIINITSGSAAKEPRKTEKTFM